MLECVEIRAKVERKSPKLARYVVVPAKFIAAWDLLGTTSIEAWINGLPLGRRTLKRWDEERWFLELTQPQCQAAHVDTGADLLLRLRLTSGVPPAEVVRLVEENASARADWEAMTESQRRALHDHVATAKVATTRWRRAATALGVNAPAPPDLTVRRERRDPPFEVVIHEVPVPRDDLRSPTRALDLLAAWLADEVLCTSWKEVLEAEGTDPATAGPPPELRRRPEVWERFLRGEPCVDRDADTSDVSTEVLRLEQHLASTEVKRR